MTTEGVDDALIQATRRKAKLAGSAGVLILVGGAAVLGIWGSLPELLGNAIGIGLFVGLIGGVVYLARRTPMGKARALLWTGVAFSIFCTTTLLSEKRRVGNAYALRDRAATALDESASGDGSGHAPAAGPKNLSDRNEVVVALMESLSRRVAATSRAFEKGLETSGLVAALTESTLSTESGRNDIRDRIRVYEKAIADFRNAKSEDVSYAEKQLAEWKIEQTVSSSLLESLRKGREAGLPQLEAWLDLHTARTRVAGELLQLYETGRPELTAANPRAASASSPQIERVRELLTRFEEIGKDLDSAQEAAATRQQQTAEKLRSQ